MPTGVDVASLWLECCSSVVSQASDPETDKVYEAVVARTRATLSSLVKYKRGNDAKVGAAASLLIASNSRESIKKIHKPL